MAPFCLGSLSECRMSTESPRPPHTPVRHPRAGVGLSVWGRVGVARGSACSSHIQGRKRACFISERETEALDSEALPLHGAADEAAGASVPICPPRLHLPPNPTPWVTPLA